MRSILLPAAGLTLALAAAPAHAGEQGRYTLERTGDSYVRLDRQTGAMSTCSDRNGQLVCRVAADERQAFEDEIDRLEGRLDRLERRVAALEAAKPGPGSTLLPSNEDVDRTLDFMERFFRRFLGIVKDFDRDLRKDNSDTAPDRT
jgi:hypothetical protein